MDKRHATKEAARLSRETSEPFFLNRDLTAAFAQARVLGVTWEEIEAEKSRQREQHDQ